MADTDPDAIAKVHVDPAEGLSESDARAWVEAAKLNPDATEGAVDILQKLYTAFTDGDADLVEINPLILTPDGRVHALDAKVTLDDNAAFRHDWAEYEATQVRDEREQAANFLDIGGGANADVMASALEVINNDEKVKSIFINIFGGITRGEEVANGIVQALGRVEISSPIVIRLDGTNAEEGRAILAEHASDTLLSKPTMLEAAATVVELAAKGA